MGQVLCCCQLFVEFSRCISLNKLFKVGTESSLAIAFYTLFIFQVNVTSFYLILTGLKAVTSARLNMRIELGVQGGQNYLFNYLPNSVMW